MKSDECRRKFIHESIKHLNRPEPLGRGFRVINKEGRVMNVEIKGLSFYFLKKTTITR